ncbi:A24 family peptidase [Pluralibacter sp.]|uniref:prepilin peptidase n=1 Tax=Pluralibacter sp. TaxID=1920032 RepID=UPI0025FD8517|nr:A24 family peptidase [Pluralibacter sp.]MBV8041152.1 prepilin peptidase [Pluralibacter sp.]
MITTLPFLLIYLVLNLALSLCDLRRRLLPDALTCPLLWFGLLFNLICHEARLSQAVLGAIAGYSAFAAVYWGYRLIRKREGLGYGDVKFLAALGAWHGGSQLPQLVMLASLLALLAIGIQITCKRSLQAIKNPLPFGPCLAVAGFICGWKSLFILPL